MKGLISLLMSHLVGSLKSLKEVQVTETPTAQSPFLYVQDSESVKGDSDGTGVSDTFNVGFKTSEDLEAVIAPLLYTAKYGIMEDLISEGYSITNIESVEYDAGVSEDYTFWSDSTRFFYTSSPYSPAEADIAIGFDGNTVFVGIVAYDLLNATASEVAEGGITQTFKSAFISNPLGDNDGDGLLNYRAILLTRTDPNSRDTHGDRVFDAGALSADIPPRVDYTPLINSVKAVEIQDIKDDPAAFDFLRLLKLIRLKPLHEILVDPTSPLIFRLTASTRPPMLVRRKPRPALLGRVT